MKLRVAACAVLLAAGACAAKEPRKESAIVAARVTFRSHLSAARNCESLGLTPSPEAAEAAGANLALVFAPPFPAARERANRPGSADDPAWVPFEGNTDGVAGVRAFRCPDAFLEEVAARMKRRAGPAR